MATQASTHTESQLPSQLMAEQQFVSSRANPIDLTNEADDLTERRSLKRPRLEDDRAVTPVAPMSSMTLSTQGSSDRMFNSLAQRQSSVPATSSFSDNAIQSLFSSSAPRPKFLGPSSSSAFFPNRRVQTTSMQSPLVTGPTISNGSRPSESEVIDLTISPSPPPQQPSQQPERINHGQSGILDVPPKAAVLIGQLTVTALVLYPISYLQHGATISMPSETEWATVRLQYDSTVKQRNPNAEETIHIMTPPMRSSTGEVIPGENFGVVEQKVANVLGPMLGKGLIRIDAKVRRGVPNLPILPLQMLVHTPNGNIPIVSRYLQQSGLLLDHPSSIWDPIRINRYLYSNPHNPPPGGYARALGLSTRLARVGQNSNWNSPGVTSKSVEVQRSQVDEVFKSLKNGEELHETEPSPNIKTKLYPHQKKALTFLLVREKEVSGPGGRSSSLWQQKVSPQTQKTVWSNIITKKEVELEPKECKGALLADDMGLGKTITCVSLIAATLSTARQFSTTPLPPLTKSPLDEPMSSLSASHFAGGVWDMPDAAPSGGGSHAKQARLQKEHEKWETECARARRIKVRSRATLIICPLSTVVNWEDQFREHWSGDVQIIGGPGSATTLSQPSTCSTNVIAVEGSTCPKQQSADLIRGSSSNVLVHESEAATPEQGKERLLRIYIYHGNTRCPDPNFLANFDAVITTYATLASEYSKQTKSLVSQEAEDDEDETVTSDNHTDASGNQIVMLTEAKDRKSSKRRKGGAISTTEISSALQSIHWFRIVLDEAHSIKETSTVASRASCDLEADRRLCLTGTPVQNKLDDVYALIKFLRLNPFDEKSVWQEYIGTPVKFGQPLGYARLQTIMKCITLRRTKESRSSDGKAILSLPPRRDEVRLLKFDEKEQHIYDEFFNESRDEFKRLSHKNEVMKNYVGILQKILRLRQICDHYELVKGKNNSDSDINYEEIMDSISKEGLDVPRASAIFSLIRDSGTAQCVDCGCELGFPPESSQKEGDLDCDYVPQKRGKRSKTSSRLSTRQNSPTTIRVIMSRCQHLFCIMCFQHNVFPKWPNTTENSSHPCSVCQTMLQPTDAVEVNPDYTASEPTTKKKNVRKEKRQKGANLDNFHPSTKVNALLGDLITYSRSNPYSANYDPTSVEVQMVDETGKEIDDGVVKTVVFSQWTTMLDKIEDALEAAVIRYDRLDGTMKRDERTRAMDALKNDPACEVLLVSLKAGGVGLNLTAAQRVYLMDPYWNPAVENQAVDRIHRLGQSKPVTTVKLIMENTIEEKLLEVQRKKTELANKTLGQGLSKAEVHQRRMEELNNLLG